jgi:acetolactate synthase regulatory subunit
VDLPRTMARVSQLLAHRFGAVEELNMRRVDESAGALSIVLDGPESRVELLIKYLERIVGVTTVEAWSAATSSLH